MPELGIPELLIILVIVLIIFGPGRLTGAGAALGKAIREFREGVTSRPKESTATEVDAIGQEESVHTS
ncbi:MAG: twin-arginine translocase TatA/TatE family subunit [Anaerolineae bacterium]